MDRSSSIAVQFAAMIPETKAEMQRALCAQTSRKALSLSPSLSLSVCVSLWLFIFFWFLDQIFLQSVCTLQCGAAHKACK
jgi:hypothetical protein